jgi:translation initiation factor IF-2
MANIRAYKLAEELGIERSEIVERAAEVGVELKNPMAAVDEETAQLLREKFGKTETKKVVTERRVQQSGGAAVIRRRKKAAPAEPPPEPVVIEPEVPSAPEPIAAAVDSEVLPEEAEPAPEGASIPAPEPTPAPAPIAAEAESAGEARPTSTRPAPGSGGGGDRAGADRSGRQRKLVREVVNLREQERLARQATGRAPLRRQVNVDPRTATSPRRKRRDALGRPASPAAKKAAAEQKRVLRIEGSVSVGELARQLGAKAPDIQRRLMALGTMVSINQMIDVATATKLASELDFEVQDVGFKEQEFFEQSDRADEAALVQRSPVVTVMGHVDHGKTSLLDAIRNANVVAGEAGGITQHIGAYQAKVDSGTVTFIDTPGHAAFTEMRARGAKVTDLVILVVAATEGLMPQTIEAIEHSKAAGVPIVVAINKCDLPGSNPQQVRQRLMEHELVAEEFGGDTITVEVSATQGTGLEKLLEMIHLQSELLELKADPNQRASGIVIEAQLDKGKGPVATVLVQGGTLQRGDIVVVGTTWGRIRAMDDENAKRIEAAGPSVPVQITGLTSVPDAGDPFHVVENERVAKEIISHRESEQRDRPAASTPRLSLDELFAQSEGGGIKELKVVIKADTQGSVEALRDSLLKLSTDSVKVDVLLTGVGAVNETDVMLAKASEGIIIGFHVRPDPAARRAAEGQGVGIRTYRIIYEVVDGVRNAMAGLLPPTVTEKFEGRAEVRDTFNVPKLGTIAGCYVSEGQVKRGGPCRLLRDGVQIYEGRIGSLKRFKDDAREVNTGFECGIGIDGYGDVKIGDVIETYSLEEKPAKLE